MACHFIMEVSDALIQGCLDGNEKSQFDLFKLCFPHLMRICDRYHVNEIDARSDLNESFLKILTKLESFDRSKNFFGWSRQIVIRTVIDNFRKKKVKYAINFEDQEKLTGLDLSNTIVLNEADLICDADELLSIIKKLPDATRRIFNLFALEGFSHQEIAEKLEISTGTSKWHVHNARKQLQKQIKEMKYKKSGSYV